MEREKNLTGGKTESTSLKVVVVKNDQVYVEREIEKHIKKIKSLINKLRPAERQKYFNGLLSHLLHEPVEAPVRHSKTIMISDSEKDYSSLTVEELSLIEELGQKVEQLYRTMDYDPS